MRKVLGLLLRPFCQPPKSARKALVRHELAEERFDWQRPPGKSGWRIGQQPIERLDGGVRGAVSDQNLGSKHSGLDRPTPRQG